MDFFVKLDGFFWITGNNFRVLTQTAMLHATHSRTDTIAKDFERGATPCTEFVTRTIPRETCFARSSPFALHTYKQLFQRRRFGPYI